MDPTEPPQPESAPLPNEGGVPSVPRPCTPSPPPSPIYATVVPHPRTSPRPSHPHASTPPSSHPHASTLPPALPQHPISMATTAQPPVSVATAVPSHLGLRVESLEAVCVGLQREKRALKEERRVALDGFNRQRKTFMNQMMQTEGELSLSRHSVERYSKEVRELSTQLLLRDEELSALRQRSKMAYSSTREAFDADRVKYEEAIQVLQRALEERDAVLASRQQDWLSERRALEEDISRLQGPSPPGPAPPDLEPDGLVSVGGRKVKLHLHDPKDSLETSMTKAAEDTKVLKAVIVPLEEEIDMLRFELQEAHQRLQVYEGGGRSLTTPPLIDFDSSPPPGAVLDGPVGADQHRDLLNASPTSEVGRLLRQLDLERSARHDLEMHSEQLRAQKSLLHDEVTSLKHKLEQVHAEFAGERLSQAELKQTWQLANQHFIVAQDQLKAEIYRLRQRPLTSDPVNRQPEEESFPRVAGVGGGNMSALAPLSSSRQLSHSTELRPTSSAPSNSAPTSTARLTRSASWGQLKLPSPSSHEEEREERREEGRELERVVRSLQDELTCTGQELARQRKVTSSYEAQLQRVQYQMVAELEEKEQSLERLRKDCDKLKAGIARERNLRKDLKKSMEEAREEMRMRIETFQSTERELGLSLRTLRENFTSTKHSSQKEIAKFSDDRIRQHRQLVQSAEEYERAKAAQSDQLTTTEQQKAEAERLRREAERNVAAVMGELGALRASMSGREEELCTHLSLLKEELLAEQSARGKLEAAFAAARTTALQEVADLEGLKGQLDQEISAKEEALSGRAYIEERSRTFIQQQQGQLEQLSSAKEACEHQVRDLQRQLSLMRSQLSTSESTQKDFVQLSQTLQVQLAAMEESRQVEGGADASAQT